MPEIVVEFYKFLDRTDVQAVADEYGLTVIDFTGPRSKMTCPEGFEASGDMEYLSQENVVKRILRQDGTVYAPVGACDDLIIEFQETASQVDIDALGDTFKLVFVDKLEDGRHRIYCPQRQFMGSADLEDLSESPVVKRLFWGDGSPCRPRG